MKKALFYTFAAGMAVMSSLTASAQNEGGGAAVEKCKSVTKTPEANAPAKGPLLYDYTVFRTDYTNSGAQPAIVSDREGNYIYTGSPNPDETGDKHVFHKYDYSTWSAEGFDIAGVPGVSSLTSDGTYFYGVFNNEFYKMDFDKKQLLEKSVLVMSGLNGIIALTTLTRMYSGLANETICAEWNVTEICGGSEQIFRTQKVAFM